MDNPRDRKLAVLHQLLQESEPISLTDLMKKLGSGFADRSVRRWIGEMIQEGLAQKQGSRKAAKYFASKGKTLIKYNLVPLSFVDIEKDDYNSAMIAIYEKQDIRPYSLCNCLTNC